MSCLSPAFWSSYEKKIVSRVSLAFQLGKVSNLQKFGKYIYLADSCCCDIFWALKVLVSLNNPGQPHLVPPPTPVGLGAHLSSIREICSFL